MMKIKIVLLLSLILFTISGKSQDLVYTPTNPAFGGYYYNYQWMLSSAQAQDTYKDKSQVDPYSRYESNPVDDFAESLNRQILSRLSREIVTRQFGEDALDEGSYLLGDYQININNTDDGISIVIVDAGTGATTTVSVPYF